MDPGGALRGEAVPLWRLDVSIFLDTNVVLYAYDRHEPEKRQIARAVLEDSSEPLVVSTQVLAEFYSAATRKLVVPLEADHAAAAVAWLTSLTVVNADAEFVFSAIELAIARQISSWDALIVRAAQRGGCAQLLTEDLSHGEEFGSVRIENPFREAR